MRKLRKALRNQRDQLMDFARVLDQKLADIAKDFEIPLQGNTEYLPTASQTQNLRCLLGAVESVTLN